MRAIYRLIEQLVLNRAELNRIRRQLTHFERRMEATMATQEERLQAISTKIDEVIEMLGTLRDNNPQLEDEITAIETKLAGAIEPPA